MVSRIYILVLFICSCVFYSFKVDNLGKKSKPKTVPTYSEEKYWIALPTRHDIGDTLPQGCPTPENQSNASVDVFYVHPTVYLSGGPWNADLDNKNLNRKCDACVMHQATPFNSCAKVYAPRYRQAILRSFSNDGKEGHDALDTAYSDVKKAFEYYLLNWNSGRPIILVGHSQGAYHVARLLDDYFTGKPLLNQLVAAYPIGFNIPSKRYVDIPVGDSASQIKCFVTWNSVGWGQDTVGPYTNYRGSACVNPLTWTCEPTIAENKFHDGGVPFSYKKIEKNILRTQIHGTILWITFTDPSLRKGFYHLGTSYHVSDVNLFYMNIRENAELRSRIFLAQQ